jgi:xanthine dehydrogenase molybdenum-binding subunit
MNASSSTIGTRVPDVRAVDKVTGRAQYTIDIERPGMLVGRVVRSQLPRATIVSIDTSRAERLPGVKAVVTGKDVPAIAISSTFPPEYDIRVLAGAGDDMVRFVGDEVAAIAAVDEETADAAVGLVDVEYSPLPAVADATQGMQADAPDIEKMWSSTSNLMSPYSPMVLSRGDVDAGMAQADIVFTGAYDVPPQPAASLRPFSCLAEWEGDSLTIYNDTQVIFTRQAELATLLQMPIAKVRVVSPLLGGGFGEDNVYRFISLAAILSRKAGRPVKMIMPQDYAFEASPNKRHAARFTVKIGAMKDGTITAIDLTAVFDKGAYVAGGFSVPYVAARGIFNGYRTPNLRHQAYAVFTDNPPAGAFRGYGGVQSNFAVQSAMDDLAAQLGMDPTRLQLLNCIRPDDVLTIEGMAVDFSQVGGSAFIEAIGKGVSASDWVAKWKPFAGLDTEEHVFKGIGMALLTYGFGHIPDTANASVSIDKDGKVEIMMGTADLGGGQPTTMSMIVADELGVNMGDVSIAMGDSRYPAAPLGGTFGSRTTFIAGNAAKAAAANAKQSLLALAAGVLGIAQGRLSTADGMIFVEGSTQGVPFAKVMAALPNESKISGWGEYVHTPAVSRSGFQFGACFAEVEVDTWTGKVTTTNLTMIQDYGKAINPLAVEGQMQGAAIQGLGYSLLEDYVVDKTTSQSLTRDWIYYHVPTIMDVPEMTPIVLENPDPRGPFGAKGGGESMIICTHSAIRNAVANAIGVRFVSLPITPQMVIDAVKASGGK